MIMCWKWLTSSIVHSNVYGLGNVHCVRYLTAVDSVHSTSSAVQAYHHVTSCSVKVPVVTTARNYSSIGEKPVPSSTAHITSIIRMATRRLVSHAEQAIIIIFTNVLQDHKTVVPVCCTSE